MTRSTSTWSRCTPATCGARSTCRSAAVRCRPSAGPATGWPWMAADQRPPRWPRPARRATLSRRVLAGCEEARMPRRIARWLAFAAAAAGVLWVGWASPGHPATTLTRVDVVVAVLILGLLPWVVRRRYGPVGPGWLAQVIRLLGYAAVFALLLAKAVVERRGSAGAGSHAGVAGAWTGEIVFLVVLAAYTAGLLIVTACRPPAGRAALVIGTAAGVV